MWIIVGIIMFLITLYIHKHTYIRRYYGRIRDEKKCPSPLWAAIIALILLCIPVFGIIVFVVGLISYSIYLSGAMETEIYFKPTGVVKKIIDFLKKEI